MPELPESWLIELSGGVYQGTECLPGISGTTRDFQDIEFSLSEKKISENLGFLETQIEELIQRTLPTEPGRRHRSLFDFARGLKFMPELKGKPIGELKPVVKQWHERHRVGTLWADFRQSKRRAIDVAAGHDRIKVGQIEGVLLQLLCGGDQFPLSQTGMLDVPEPYA